MNDLITVIVPVFNTGAPLAACVDSIVNQTYSPLEIILVDDGSTDEQTLAICKKYEDSYENVFVIHQLNGGAACARNTGIDKAKGRYIAFVDSDDLIDKDAYANLHSYAIKYNAPVVLGNLSIEGARQHFGHSGFVDGSYNQKQVLSKFLQGYWSSACTNLYSLECIKNIRFPVNEINEDYIFNFEVLRNCNNIALYNEPFYHYIRRENSVTSKPASMKHLDWIKHTEYVRTKTKQLFYEELNNEADFQYFYCNIILANKCVLNLAKGYSGEPERVYKIATDNLNQSKIEILRNPCLSLKFKFSALLMIIAPTLYKNIVSRIIKLKR